MLEIIALIFLTRQMGNIAFQKGLKPGPWKVYTVLAWLAGEFVGVIIGIMIFGVDNLISIELVGITGAITGYLILKSFLSKKPDNMQDDIDQIGQG
jgi:hypothetical protein